MQNIRPSLFERSAGFQPPIMGSLLLKHQELCQPPDLKDVSGLSLRGSHQQLMPGQSSELSGHLFKRREQCAVMGGRGHCASVQEDFATCQTYDLTEKKHVAGARLVLILN